MLAEVRAWRLADMRQERGFTQAQVAEHMGVSKGRVSQIESGQVSVRMLWRDTWRRWAAAW
ncbi:helix-turn-helix domain-containing protein [Streptomyces sp. KR55]|uniref:helix-turn-helix domain-containing protein n=1 Tax=Streptomyces sp. KR55 TaxID=3457425 RepID=UPI003FD472AA